jgi:hypothetical protein
MITREGATLQAGSGGLSRQAKALTLVASTVFWLVLLSLLLRSMVIEPWQEPPAVRAERIVQAEVAPSQTVTPAPLIKQAAAPLQQSVLPQPQARADTQDTRPAPQSKAPTDRPTPDQAAPRPGNAAPAAAAAQPVGPRIATSGPASEQARGPSPTQGAALPSLQGRTGTLALLRARECLKIEIGERPPDCPPNEELLALARAALAKAKDAQYRPENAEAFSRNELKWRGIPPPCLDDGQAAGFKGGKLCVRFGNIPSKVRTWEEICEARGLGGCTRPDQAAVDRAVKSLETSPSP